MVNTAGVLGATSMVGQSLVPMLADAGWRVQAFSRQTQVSDQVGSADEPVVFRTLPATGAGSDKAGHDDVRIPDWVCLAPLWVLPEYFPMLTACQARRVVALGSTSIFTKQHSLDMNEQATAEKLRHGERCFIEWAEASRIKWVILRPTLIYGLGRDRNICEIAKFILRFGFFPLLGAAQGLRQPVHVEDVASACVAALQSSQAVNHAYNISGAEQLTYREMVKRIFEVTGKPERYISMPVSVFRAAIACLRLFPGFRDWTSGMAERMNSDLVFNHADATRDLGFSPRSFHPAKDDLPASLTGHSR
ncbi:MAG: NAD(P)-dependent oxidoreductase [Gallionella sp.]|nr:NAD(P)-dependent oxidoreductase [Gallionella sp.]